MVEGVFHMLLPSLLLFSFSAKAISLQHVTVHDPSVVWDPESKTYYIFGSHRDNAKTTDMMRWTKVAVPWATASSNNAANKDAFTTPQVTTVKKGGIDVNLPKFNAVTCGLPMLSSTRP